MLVLTRRIKESIEIGEDIKFEVLSINGQQVRLGIEAPAHISIARTEIKHKVRKQFYFKCYAMDEEAFHTHDIRHFFINSLVKVSDGKLDKYYYCYAEGESFTIRTIRNPECLPLLKEMQFDEQTIEISMENYACLFQDLVTQ